MIEKLKQILEYSEKCSKNRYKIRGYMLDVFPKDEIRTVNILLNVYEDGVVKELTSMDELTVQKYNFYLNKLQYDYGMDAESAIEALNLWISVCINKDVANKFSLIKKDEQTSVNKMECMYCKNEWLQSGMLLYEDDNVVVMFEEWKREICGSRISNKAKMLFENKMRVPIGFYLKNIILNGILQKHRTNQYVLDGGQKGIKTFELVVGERGKQLLNSNSVEFNIHYGIGIIDNDVPFAGEEVGLFQFLNKGYDSDVILLKL